MCRSCAETGVRCRVDLVAKRARDRAAYHAKKATQAGADLSAPQRTAPEAAPITREQVAELIAHAQDLLTRPGAFHQPDRNGWMVPTTQGLEAEAAVRAAGAGIAARAQRLAQKALSEVGQHRTLLAVRPQGFTDAQDYLDHVRAESERADAAAMEAGAAAARATTVMESLTTHRAEIEAITASQAAASAYSRARQGDGLYDRAESKILADAFRTALAEQREMGLDKGAKPVAHAGSHKSAITRLGKALNYYPRDWINADTVKGEGPQLLARASSARAHYIPNYPLRIGTTTEPVDLLTISNDDVGCNGPGISVAIHEYGHRMERARPRLADLSHTFLARRTSADGVRDPLENLVGGRRGQEPPSTFTSLAADTSSAEWVRADSLADAYMGREYGEPLTTEVFTTGAEAVFGGRYGGLRGAGRWRPDAEHRDLVLGALAAVT